MVGIILTAICCVITLIIGLNIGKIYESHKCRVDIDIDTTNKRVLVRFNEHFDYKRFRLFALLKIKEAIQEYKRSNANYVKIQYSNNREITISLLTSHHFIKFNDEEILKRELRTIDSFINN